MIQLIQKVIIIERPRFIFLSGLPLTSSFLAENIAEKWCI